MLAWHFRFYAPTFLQMLIYPLKKWHCHRGEREEWIFISLVHSSAGTNGLSEATSLELHPGLPYEKRRLSTWGVVSGSSTYVSRELHRKSSLQNSNQYARMACSHHRQHLIHCKTSSTPTDTAKTSRNNLGSLHIFLHHCPGFTLSLQVLFLYLICPIAKNTKCIF